MASGRHQSVFTLDEMREQKASYSIICLYTRTRTQPGFFNFPFYIPKTAHHSISCIAGAFTRRSDTFGVFTGLFTDHASRESNPTLCVKLDQGELLFLKQIVVLSVNDDHILYLTALVAFFPPDICCYRVPRCLRWFRWCSAELYCLLEDSWNLDQFQRAAQLEEHKYALKCNIFNHRGLCQSFKIATIILVTQLHMMGQLVFSAFGVYDSFTSISLSSSVLICWP